MNQYTIENSRAAIESVKIVETLFRKGLISGVSDVTGVGGDGG